MDVLIYMDLWIDVSIYGSMDYGLMYQYMAGWMD